MFSVPSQTDENFGKICENSPVGENPQLRLGFSLICSQMFYFINHSRCKFPFLKRPLLFETVDATGIVQVAPESTNMLDYRLFSLHYLSANFDFKKSGQRQ